MADNPEQQFRTEQQDDSGLCVREAVYAHLETYYGSRQPYRLDVLTSETVPQNGYAVLFVHGGGFSQPCDRRQSYIGQFARELCSHGYTVVSPDYPLFREKSEFWQHPENHLRAFHTSSDAVNAAYGFIMEHAEEFGIRPGKAAIMGGSAGSMASVYAVSKAPENYFALVSLWGPPSILPDVSGFPPTLCVHGMEDRTVPFALERPLADRLEAAGVQHELIALPGAAHTPVAQLPEYMPAILDLLEKTRP